MAAFSFLHLVYFFTSRISVPQLGQYFPSLTTWDIENCSLPQARRLMKKSIVSMCGRPISGHASSHNKPSKSQEYTLVSLILSPSNNHRPQSFPTRRVFLYSYRSQLSARPGQHKMCLFLHGIWGISDSWVLARPGSP